MQRSNLPATFAKTALIGSAALALAALAAGTSAFAGDSTSGLRALDRTDAAYAQQSRRMKQDHRDMRSDEMRADRPDPMQHGDMRPYPEQDRRARPNRQR